LEELMTYHNTNCESGETLKRSRKQANKQEKIVLAVFRNEKRLLAPHQVHAIGFDGHTPLTSVRRAITNLTDLGYLEKTDEMVMGLFGKAVHMWKLPSDDSPIPGGVKGGE
jgi:hypothetical protein